MKRLGTRVHFIPSLPRQIPSPRTAFSPSSSVYVHRVKLYTHSNLLTLDSWGYRSAGYPHLHPPIEADDESAELACTLTNTIPFSIISSTEDVNYFLVVEKENHCDFKKLCSLIIRKYIISMTEESLSPARCSDSHLCLDNVISRSLALTRTKCVLYGMSSAPYHL